MHIPSVKFSTNIDCYKIYMGSISGLPNNMINQLVGDKIRVYHDSVLDIYLNVVEREWTFTNGSTPQLTCHLHLENGWTIPILEKAIRS